MSDAVDTEKPPRSLVVPCLLAVVAVLVGLAAFMVLPMVRSEPPGPGCRVTPEGEELRRHMAVERDQRPDGVAGDTYTAWSGCLPGDDRLD